MSKSEVWIIMLFFLLSFFSTSIQFTLIYVCTVCTREICLFMIWNNYNVKKLHHFLLFFLFIYKSNRFDIYLHCFYFHVLFWNKNKPIEVSVTGQTFSIYPCFYHVPWMKSNIPFPVAATEGYGVNSKKWLLLESIQTETTVLCGCSIPIYRIYFLWLQPPMPKTLSLVILLPFLYFQAHHKDTRFS